MTRAGALALALALTLVTACAAAAAGEPGPSKKRDRMFDKGLALLAKGDAASVCKGADLLARSGKPEAVQPLLGHLRTRDERVRDCVREALGQLDAAPVVLARWRSKALPAREEALEWAVALPHPGLMPLYAEAAGATDAFFRQRAATGLRRQAEGPKLWALLEALAADADRDVRWWTVDTLSLSRSAEARRILEARRSVEQEPRVKAHIDKALGDGR